MPKKYQQKSLQIKPQSSSPHTLSLSHSSTTQQGPSQGPSQRTVNDLIRDSRRQQLRKEKQNSPHGTVTTTTAGSVPPSVRSSILPAGSFPPERSLQHLALKKIASNWAWHVEYEREYLAELPLNLKETLLSYLSIYNELGSPGLNPLRVLFLDGEQYLQEDRDEVQRLDLGNGIGLWTSLKGLEKDLVTKTVARRASDSIEAQDKAGETPDSWDADDDSDDLSNTSLAAIPRVIQNFQNLKHLSLSISPGNTNAASWTTLVSIATELGTLSSLSLAHWPQPTFTPNAASTRAVVHVAGARPVVYGGTNIYSSLDNDWREAAGILRTLSRALYCLTWLDLTGCGDWWEALIWPSLTSSNETAETENLGPEWNGGWRGLEKLVLHPGWKPIPPPPHVARNQTDPSGPSWNVEHERIIYRFQKEEQRLAEMERTASRVAAQLRTLRKSCGGRWLDVDMGPPASASSSKGLE